MVFFTLTPQAGFCLWKMAPVLTSQKTPNETLPVNEATGLSISLPAANVPVDEQPPPEEENAFLSPQQKGGDV